MRKRAGLSRFFADVGIAVAEAIREVPWPIGVLSLGFALAVTFIVCAVNGWQSAGTFFVATAGVSIAIGVVGLFVHTRRQKAAPAEVVQIPTRASIYRQYPVRIDAALVERWATAAIQLKEQLEARDWPVDWPSYKSQADAAAKAVADGDHMTAFRHYCRALNRLANPFNRHRPKEESFRPKWETNGA